MGIVEIKKGETHISVELLGGMNRHSEIKPGDFSAIFLLAPNEVHHFLAAKVEAEANDPKELESRPALRGLLQKCKKTGTEVWLGDPWIKDAQGAILYATITSAITPPFLEWISRRGNATNRRISRKIVATTGKLWSELHVTNKVVAQKIHRMLEKTGHRRIGIITTAEHAGLVDLLAKPQEITDSDRESFAEPERQIMKLQRLQYNKDTKRWEVTEHCFDKPR